MFTEFILICLFIIVLIVIFYNNLTAKKQKNFLNAINWFKSYHNPYDCRHKTHDKRCNVIKFEKNEKSYKLNRHDLQNRNVQDFLYPILQEYLYVAPDFSNIKFENIQLIRNDENEINEIVARFNVFDKNVNNWNITQVLMLIRLKRVGGSDNFQIVEFDKFNTIDTNAIIPQMSDLSQTYFKRPREWSKQRMNWDSYKKDWDVTWSDIPIHR